MINLDKTKIILASKSPRRSELMKQAGLEFEIIASDAEEIITKTVPSDIVEELSTLKASHVLDMILKSVDLSLMAFDDLSLLIIGADTIVCKDEHILGKPADRDDAYRMINLIQGTSHQVYTGVSLLLYDFSTGGRTSHTFNQCTNVNIYPMSDREINNYISTSDCYDKAGAYGIQGEFAIYVKSIDGDYNNVVGLPIARLYHELQKL
jgi:septum formation protein